MPRSSTLSTSKVVFAGIDFHKRFSVVTLGDQDGRVVSQKKLENDRAIIRGFFLEHAPLTCAIENCRASEWFIDTIKDCGCEIKVSNTYMVRLIADSTKKNDKIDSKYLMELLVKDYLPTVYQPTQEERLLREKLRWRVKLINTRTAYKNAAHRTRHIR